MKNDETGNNKSVLIVILNFVIEREFSFSFLFSFSNKKRKFEWYPTALFISLKNFNPFKFLIDIFKMKTQDF